MLLCTYCANTSVRAHTSEVCLFLSVLPKGKVAIHSKKRCPLRKDNAQRQHSCFFMQISHQIRRSLNIKGTLSPDLVSSCQRKSPVPLWQAVTGSLFCYLLLQKNTPTTLSLLWQDSWCFHHWNISWGFNIAEVSVTERHVCEFRVSCRHLWSQKALSLSHKSGMFEGLFPTDATTLAGNTHT